MRAPRSPLSPLHHRGWLDRLFARVDRLLGWLSCAPFVRDAWQARADDDRAPGSDRDRKRAAR